MVSVQSSFKDVRCINSGAIPFPKHGRQIEIDDKDIKDEEVYISVSHDMTKFSRCPLLQP